MYIDPITQYILHEDAKQTAKAAAVKSGQVAKRVGNIAATQVKNKAAKTSRYVATKVKKKFGKQLSNEKCRQLHDITSRHLRGQGSCSASKAEYYKRLTLICDDGFKLQALMSDLNTKLMRPSTKKETKAEMQRLKQRILGHKEKMAISKKIVEKNCSEEAERAVDARVAARVAKQKLRKKR